MEEYYLKHDEPNLTYELLGQQVCVMARLGATDEELQGFMRKGGVATIRDVAEIKARHLYPKNQHEKD